VHRLKCRRTGLHEARIKDALSYLVAALPVVRRLLRSETYDVLHCFFSLPTGAMLPFLDLRDVPVVVSLRGSDVPGYDPYNLTLQRVHRLAGPLTRWIWRRADRVVALSESLGQLALQTLPTLRYSVVHNGVDLWRFRPRPVSRRRSERIHCLAVARLIERKGLAELITALASLQRGRYHLEIVGSGPDESPLRALALRLGVAAEVTFAGSVDRATLARRYRAADLFALASREESFGNVFAEAMASGLPIVGTAVGGIPEFIEHGQNGLLVPPGNPQALAAAIEVLGENPRLRNEMGRRNRLKAETHLAWSRATGRYLTIYHGVTRTPAMRPIMAELSSSSW
jgi:glycosyltransferase involved in cell wall biosynthesis